MYRFVLLAVCSGLLSGLLSACSLGGGSVPQDHYYQLTEVSVKKQSETRFKHILINPVQAGGLYHERAILYIEKDKPLELQRYFYNFWVDTPTKLLFNALYQAALSSGVSQRVSREPVYNQPGYNQKGDSRPDIEIDSRIIHFERVINGDVASIEVALELTVHINRPISVDSSVDLSGSSGRSSNSESADMPGHQQQGGLVAEQQWSRRYQSSQQLDTTNMHASAEAFARAVQLICEQLIADLLLEK